MIELLRGLTARRLTGDIYEIRITGYGPADVGPYHGLLRHVGRGSGLECHHIVEAEHLKMISTRFTERNAPAVAIPQAMHRRLISPRFTAEHGSVGGRDGGKVQLSRTELLKIYKEVYTWHTPFRELYSIAERVLL